jgi:hypothetical protein
LIIILVQEKLKYFINNSINNWFRWFLVIDY